MKTECTTPTLPFARAVRREIVARFNGGDVTSDAGSLLLREVNLRAGILEDFAGCFIDHRNPDLIEHSVLDLVSQRVYGLCLGYEDLNDHDELRTDPMLAALVGKRDPKGERRERKRDRGKALAGKSTLNRLELTSEEVPEGELYKKIVLDQRAADRLFVKWFLDAHDEPPEDVVKELDWILAQIREAWPEVRIVIRGDSDFGREETMAFCEALPGVDYVFGLRKNPRLLREVSAQLREAERKWEQTGEAARVFKNFYYQTLDSWSRSRRVVGKAEHIPGKSNPRFVVTSLSWHRVNAKVLYEERYCPRGDMENRIKECQLHLFSDRTSTSWMRSNQIRLTFSSVAYVLMQMLRHVGLEGTEMERAQCGTIRTKLLKIGARVKVTVRRIWVAMSSAYPYQGVVARILEKLQRWRPLKA